MRGRRIAPAASWGPPQQNTKKPTGKAPRKPAAKELSRSLDLGAGEGGMGQALCAPPPATKKPAPKRPSMAESSLLPSGPTIPQKRKRAEAPPMTAEEVNPKP